MKRFIAGMVCGWLLLAVVQLGFVLKAQQKANGPVVQAQALVDNQKVTIRRWKLAPGEQSPVHTHSLDHIYVVIHGSDIRDHLADGTIHDDDQETGRVGFSPGVGKTHFFENVGNVPYEMVSIELKPTP
jgi:predicted metal-dependent enzyme (double-stranded beta helix superfamily)